MRAAHEIESFLEEEFDAREVRVVQDELGGYRLRIKLQDGTVRKISVGEQVFARDPRAFFDEVSKRMAAFDAADARYQ